jgi:hypothetical protein
VVIFEALAVYQDVYASVAVVHPGLRDLFHTHQHGSAISCCRLVKVRLPTQFQGFAGLALTGAIPLDQVDYQLALA